MGDHVFGLFELELLSLLSDCLLGGADEIVDIDISDKISSNLGGLNFALQLW